MDCEALIAAYYMRLEARAIAPGGICTYCGKPTDSLAADPHQWPLVFPDADALGEPSPHHAGCVARRLAEADRLRDVEQEANGLRHEAANDNLGYHKRCRQAEAESKRLAAELEEKEAEVAALRPRAEDQAEEIVHLRQELFQEQVLRAKADGRIGGDAAKATVLIDAGTFPRAVAQLKQLFPGLEITAASRPKPAAIKTEEGHILYTTETYHGEEGGGE